MGAKGLFLGIAIGAMIGVFIFIFVLGPIGNPFEVSENEGKEGVTLSPVYHLTLYRPGEGIIYEQDVTNVITNNGLNLVRCKMAALSTDCVANVTYMGLSNDSADPAIANTNLSGGGAPNDGREGEHTSGGLGRAAGTVSFGQNAGSDDPGNWSVSYKWTATVDFDVWKFGVFNGTKLWDASEEDTMFSAGNFTANVSMQANDELTVNVTYIVS